jgi:ABC-type multidrug transport system fused ATPase/permease subunit
MSRPDSSTPRSVTSVRSRLTLLLGSRRRSIVALATFSILSGFAEAGTLALVADIATRLVGNSSRHGSGRIGQSLFHFNVGVGTLILIAFGLCVVRLLLQLPLSVLPARIAADVQASLRNRLFDAFNRASWTVQSSDREGQLQETITGQVMQAVTGAAGTTQLVTASFQFAVLMITALVLNPVAALIVGATSVLLFGALRPLRAIGSRNMRELSQAQVRYAGGIAESNRLAEETHVFGVKHAQRERVSALVAVSQEFYFRGQVVVRAVTNVYQSLIYVLLVAGLGFLYLWGGRHASSLGAVVLLLLRAGNAGQLVQGSYQTIMQALPFIERTQDTLKRYDESAEKTGETPLPSVATVAFDHVSFAYEPSTPVLSDVSFEAFSGEAIGIVGPSGAGKSTLVQILLRLRPPGGGRYLVNGIPCEQFYDADWRRQVSYVPQEPRLLHASVAENIRFFRDISDEDVERAARLARIHDDIVSWENGYDAIVGPRADAVSGGQQQRICLARALAARPAMLILDEPTSALDPHSEALIGESLLGIRSTVTLFIVAHRMSTLEMCDRVMVILDGRLAGFDTKEALQRQNSYYRNASQLAAGGTLP